jgi:membrane protease YdiL (CAAX protease family)
MSATTNARSTDSTVWSVRHPVIAAIGLSLVPVVFTAAGFAIAQVLGQNEAATYATVAASVTVSAFVALVVMRFARPSLSEFGLRAPRGAATALWWLPLLLVVGLVFTASGVVVPLASIAPIVWLAVAVGFNEELVYRGLVLAILRRYGTRRAVLFSAVIFGVLHLANIGSGKSPAYLAAQVLFSALFGVVTAELVAVTGSLWPGILFHAAYDAVSYMGGDAVTRDATISLAVQVVLLASYAWWLWTRVPHEHARVAA